MLATDPVVTCLLVLAIGVATGILFDWLAGPSLLTRQFSGSTRGIITSELRYYGANATSGLSDHLLNLSDQSGNC
jgi:hypothetical protein